MDFVFEKTDRNLTSGVQNGGMKSPLWIWLLWLLLLVVGASPARSDQIDTYIREQMQRQRIPGLSLAVIRDGRIVRAGGYGLANVELGVPATAETVYQSGSVGKQFTATVVMLLVEEGKLSLDGPISRYLDGTPPAWKEITIRHLLTHTSGIPDYESKGDLSLDYRRDYTDDELVALAEKTPLAFAPGEKWSYSNTGYVLLGIIVNKVSGRFYGDILQNRVFGPLGMKSSRIISDRDIVLHRAAGYQLVDGLLKNQGYVSPSLNRTADGSLYLTVGDLAKWDRALYTDKVLTRASLEQIWTPVQLNSGQTAPYGFGWRLASVGSHRLIEHSGQWQGFTSQISRYVDDRLTVVVLTNLANAKPEVIAHTIAGFLLPQLGRAASGGE
ncbi:beta-lactamase [Gloeobacter kilaueensis JS1]|uniref:Beta-lactamase n=2 Tax=Gloeobacter TaxID=33071 RepID=U5QJU4_GLOK1|nr:beta-lactamase [Gloeobacter kilaueensis JS1]